MAQLYCHSFAFNWSSLFYTSGNLLISMEHTLAIMQSTVKKRIFDFIDNMTHHRYGARATKQNRANKTNILTEQWISQRQRQHKRQTFKQLQNTQKP